MRISRTCVYGVTKIHIRLNKHSFILRNSPCGPPSGCMGILVEVFLFHKTVMLEFCHKLLSEDVIPELENQGLLNEAGFQQDGVKPHTVDVILMLL